MARKLQMIENHDDSHSSASRIIRNRALGVRTQLAINFEIKFLVKHDVSKIE